MDLCIMSFCPSTGAGAPTSASVTTSSMPKAVAPLRQPQATSKSSNYRWYTFVTIRAGERTHKKMSSYFSSKAYSATKTSKCSNSCKGKSAGATQGCIFSIVTFLRNICFATMSRQESVASPKDAAGSVEVLATVTG